MTQDQHDDDTDQGRKAYVAPAVVSVPLAAVEDAAAEHYREAAARWAGKDGTDG